MHRYFRFAGYLLPVFIVCTSAALLGARAKPSGADPYTPTKGEWLACKYNAIRSRLFSREYPYNHYARTTDDPNVIELVALIFEENGSDPVLTRQLANNDMKHGRNILEIFAKSCAFDEWLVIREVFVDEQDAKSK